MARKRLVTVEEAVLLHLLDYIKFSEADTLPLGMTQAGISHALGVRRSHVAQSLDVALAQNLVEGRLSRVKGEKRKRKCYFLSPAGTAKAIEIRNSVTAANVNCPGAGFNGTLAELAMKTEGRFSLPELALLAAEGSVTLPAHAPAPLASDPIPAIGNFFGRKAELERVLSLLDGKVRVLGVAGMPGIGKTALIARAAAGREVFWYSVPEWAGPNHAARHLSSFLAGKGSDRLRRYLEAHESPDLGDMQDIVSAETASFVMVFDDCHRAGKAMNQFLDMLVRACRASSGLGICLAGRQLQVPDSQADILTLGPLDPASSMEILKARGITGPGAKALAARGAGHPLFLALADESGSGDISQMLSREVQSSLSDAEGRMMHQISVYRQPVPAEALADTKEDLAALDGLAGHNLLMCGNGWSVHSLLREFFYSRQVPAERELRHERAAEHYARHDRSAQGKLEMLYHLFMAGDFESGLMGMAEYGPGLLDAGHTDGVLALCGMVPAEWPNRDEIFETGFLKASALDLLGMWDDASLLYNHCLALAGETADRENRPRVLRKLGAIEYRRGNLPEAEEMLAQAIGMLEPGPLLAEARGSLGVVQWKMGDLAAAEQSHMSDLAMSQAAGDRRGTARALNNLGILDWQAGRLAVALDRYSKALALAEGMADHRLVAILYSNMGDVHRAMGSAAEARRYYERCLGLAEDLKFHWQVAEAYRGLAEVVPEKRRDYLSRSLAIFKRLGAAVDAEAVKEMMR